jgi:hypothetical protein
MPPTENRSERLCPYCGWPVDDDAKFCDDCERKLPIDEPVPAQSAGERIAEPPTVPASAPTDVSTTPSEAVAAETPAPSIPAEPACEAIPGPPEPFPSSASDAPQAPSPPGLWDRGREVIEDRIAGAIPEPSDPGPPPTTGAGDLGDCLGLVVEVDAGRLLVEDMHCALRARVTALDESASRIDLHAECLWGEGKSLRFRKRLRGLGGGRSRELSIPCRIPQGVRGIKTIHWEVVYDGCCFEGETEHMVYPADASANSVAQQINLNIQQGHAGDVHLGDLLGESKDMSLRELIEQIRHAPPDWRALELWTVESLGPPQLPAAPAEAHVDRLTLRVGSRRLQLIDGDTVSLGRSRGNDLVLRAFDAQGQRLDAPSLRISGTHLSIRRTGTDVWCEDQSSNGSRLGEKPLHNSRGVLEPGAARSLDLAIHGGPVALSLELRLAHCGLQAPARGLCPDGPCERRESSALFVSRDDDVPEDYAIVWCHLALRNFRSSLPDVRIWRLDGAFAWASETGAGWLVPGTRISLPGCSGCSVEPFNQFGL